VYKRPSITYRLANFHDKAALDECLQHIIEAERPMDECLKPGHIEYYDPLNFVNQPHCNLIVAEESKQIIACGAARIQQDKNYYRYEHSLYLAMMYVAPSHRGQGINGKIIERLLTWGKEQGVTTAKLTVYPQNPSAIKAYEKLGFEPALIEMRLRS